MINWNSLSYEERLFIKKQLPNHIKLEWKEYPLYTRDAPSVYPRRGDESTKTTIRIAELPTIGIDRFFISSRRYNEYIKGNEHLKAYNQGSCRCINIRDEQCSRIGNYIINNYLHLPELEDQLKDFRLYLESDQWRIEYNQQSIKKGEQSIKSKNDRSTKFNTGDQYGIAYSLSKYIDTNTEYGYLINLIRDYYAKIGSREISAKNVDPTGKKLIDSIKALFKEEVSNSIIEYLSLHENEACRRFAVVLDEDYTTAGLFDKSEMVRMAAKKIKQKKS